MTDITTKPISLAQWLTYIEALHPKSIAMGLERVSIVANRLGLAPDFPIISIAGTNGKGSTCAMLESIYLKAGYNVGAYVSPHFIRYNERVRTNQQEIQDKALCDAFDAVETARDEIVLTYFEMGTLAAMWHFMQSNLDLAILEVGMGGRLDAVNVFEPSCSIVTSIDLDHMDYLGDTREEIGKEKAGIFRANKPAICGDENPPASLLQYANEVKAELHLITRDFTVNKEGDSWRFGTDKHEFLLPNLSLQGDFQLNNAACAISTVLQLAEQLPVSESIIGEALSAITLLGRFYHYRTNPNIILDVAHNPQAAKSLAKNLQKTTCNGRTIGVFAMLADKDIPHVIEALVSQVDSWYLADTHNARGATAKQLQSHLQDQVKHDLIKCFDSVSSALRSACIEVNKNDRIIVFGSFYTVADAIEVLRG